MPDLYRLLRSRYKRRVERGRLGHRVELRVPSEFHGRIRGESVAGYVVCPTGLGPDSLIYSVGIGFNIFFDESIIRAHGVRIHGFDPTPRSIEWVASRTLPPGFEFHPYGLADYDGTATFRAPRLECAASYTMTEASAGTDEEPPVEAPVYRLATLMERLGHRRLDVLKMDIEGAEYGVIRDICRSDLDIGQIVCEFHHHFPQIGVDATREAVDLLHEAGYRIFHISAKGREYSFLRRS